MSTNQTGNYGLHAWEREDRFLRTEINENFETIDSRAIQMLFGTYTGDGANGRYIELGVIPKAVILCHKNGFSSNDVRGGVFGPEFPLINEYAKITDSGITVGRSNTNCSTNTSNNIYHYIVLY